MSGASILLGLTMTAGAQLAWVLLWLVLVTLLVVALVVVALSRWGRSQPVRICVILSLLIHVLLAGYAATIQIVGIPREVRGPQSVDISLVDEEGASDGAHDPSGQSLEATTTSPLPVATVAELPRAKPTAPELLAQGSPTAPPLLSVPQPTAELPQAAVKPDAAPLANASEAKIPSAEVSPAQLPEKIDTPLAKRQDVENSAGPKTTGPDRVTVDTALTDAVHAPDRAAQLSTLPDLPPATAGSATDKGGTASATSIDHVGDGLEAAPAPAVAADLSARSGPGGAAAANTLASAGGLAGAGGPNGTGPAAVPEPYRMRVDADRVEHGARRGGSPEAEAAVQAGLRWLALAQSENGRWEAARYGAGRELRVDGSDRQGAGASADSAVTGLALLAFLGAGNTHLQGPYKENVRRGLEYLMSIQRTDGSLSGNAKLYEAMYCHGMASFALSEACAMTGDERLRSSVSRAAAFIVASQHPATGGWRYQPGDPGDTSQLGWQVMALRSAELAGIQCPQRTRDGIRRFLTSVASGSNGGLASYRPGEKTSRTMSAEALACREFMGMTQREEESNEAADYLLQQPPGTGEANLYYWYYATVSLYQLQDDHWQRWNQAMQQTLLASQRKDDDLAGSWDTDSVWGGYGGRVFTTSLATLCLEVYYRYLPLYGSQHGARPAALPPQR